ncbi:MAG: hypothetical protein NC341_05960 [Blautia sp.]|nr:hypothetical protein [Blautia sp.]MCM1199963.1 hypothetical protein [Bacteroides fragilis]
MKINKQWLIRLSILLFSASVSVTVFPCGMINAYGLFGEVTSSAITEDQESIISDEIRIFKTTKNSKGINIFNVWFEIWICIICSAFLEYAFRLPEKDTIVTLKVRIDD